MSGRRASAVAALSLACVLGCGAIEERGSEREIDRFSELLLVDPELLEPSSDPERALPSLPDTLAELLDAPDPSPALVQWLAHWAGETDAADQFRADVLCPWLRAQSANACDAACGVCAESRLLAAAAPFRLSALAYRPDLALADGAVHGQGELRLVYAVTRGSAADLDAPELALTVIVELPLSSRLTAQAWAQRFHALSGLRDDVPAYRRALHALVDDARKVDDVGAVSVRVQDAQHADGRMLAFRPREGRLERVALADTVDLSRTSLPELEAAFAGVHADGARAPEVPAQLWAEQVDQHSGWPTLADAKLSRALRLASCHGCHAAEHSLGGFHIAPNRSGRARVSRFLHDPDDLANDELSRRADALRTLLALPH